MSNTYENWKAVTEADFVSLFIKTWFAYISTLRVMFPEAYSRRGDKKYLNAYKTFYNRDGYKKLVVDDSIMGSIEKLYCEGRAVIMTQYPEYYLWDFYRINEDFEYTYRDIPPDKSDCVVIGLKLYRNRGTARSFLISGFVRLFGEYYNIHYDENVQFKIDIADVLKDSEALVQEHPNINEQDYLSWLLDKICNNLILEVAACFRPVFSSIEDKHGKRMLARAGEVSKRAISIIRSVFSLNGKDETFKTPDEMIRSRNTYEIIQQRPMNYFVYHMDVDWRPQREMTSQEERFFASLSERLRKNGIIWFLDFVYRLRNALFHEIIDPLDEEWQIIFKNAYLILKEIVDINIKKIKETAPVGE